MDNTLLKSYFTVKLACSSKSCLFHLAELSAALCNYQLWSFGREKIKFLKLSQMNSLDKWFTKI